MGSKPDKPEETEDYRAIIEVAGNRWNNYKDIYIPAEDYAIEESINYDNPNRNNQLSGQANVAVQGAFSDAVQDDVKQMTARGTDPSSGKFNAVTNDNSTRSAVVASDNVNRTQTALQDQEITAKKNIIALGNNQSTESIQGLNQTAVSASRDANQRAVSDYQESADRSAAVGTVAGAAGRTALERY